MEDDWDLQAVVRGCTTASSSTTTSITNSPGSFGADLSPQSCFSPFCSSEPVGNLFSLPDPFEARHAIGDLHELYKPFFSKSQPFNSLQGAKISSLSSLGDSKEQTQLKQQQRPRQSHAGSVTSSANSHNARTKRRKDQLKKICHVPADALSSDAWAWRKYGQKPIKGSPYPRGYYRCSSSKGCLARKQVERNKSDPGMFILTYTAEHNHPAPTHRNSLAGSTRQKTIAPQTVNASDSHKSSPSKPTCSSPATSVEDELLPQSTNTESREDKDMLEDDEDEEFSAFSEMAVADDFFAGLEELGSPVTGDIFSESFSANFGLPWLSNNAATAAGST